MATAITTDLLIYSIIVPVIPFRLQNLGYDGVSGLVGWLLFAYVRYSHSPRCTTAEILTLYPLPSLQRS